MKLRRDTQPTSLSPTFMVPVRRTFWLLAVRSGSPAGGPLSSSGSNGGGEPIARRVLVVEDDWLIAAQIESYLVTAGFDVTGAAVGPQEARQLVCDAPPQLALMDIRLFGDADGVELAKELWRDFGLRCLFVSGNIDADTVLRAADAHPLGWLSKPFTEAELIGAVSDAFDRLGSA